MSQSETEQSDPIYSPCEREVAEGTEQTEASKTPMPECGPIANYAGLGTALVRQHIFVFSWSN